MSRLTISIPDKNEYYSLYADGQYLEKRYIKDTGITELTYDENAVIFLYYTYPAYRQVCVIRNTDALGISLPALSKEVTQIFSLSASRIDKMKKVVDFLNRNYESAYNFSDAFYIRLYYLLLKRKTPNRLEIQRLAEKHPNS
jgi:hypothetical protein